MICFFSILFKVYGFIQNKLNETERGQGYPVNIGYIKRPPSFVKSISGEITVVKGGTASELYKHP